MMPFKKAAIIGLILVSCVGCDQASKVVAERHLSSAQPIRLLGDLFRLQYTANEGAFLGLGSGMPEAVRFWVFTVLVAAVLVGGLWFVWVSREMNQPMNLLGVSLILGGGLSNLVDRLLNNGQVVDFMNLGVGKVRTGIFNFADLAIMAGLGVLLVWNAWLRGRDEPPGGAEPSR
jgi:signal peptidase II